MLKLEARSTLVLVVDVQERLTPAMPSTRVAAVVRAARLLVAGARELGAPVLVTEQYPKGLGRTVPEVQSLFGAEASPILEKTSFSGVSAPGFDAAMQASKASAVVVMGMEAHVCVFQTVRDLAARGLAVHVAADGVCSRHDDHREAGLGLCERAGAVITTAESVLFDWLGDSAHPSFKAVSALVR